MAERLAPGVWLLDLRLHPPIGANAYLIEDGDLTLVDTGLPVSSTRAQAEIAETGHTVADIDRVFITHYDLDHVGGLARLTPELDAPVYVGEDDLKLITREVAPPILHHKGLFHRGLRRLYRLPSSLDYRPIADGTHVGGFTAFHTPGHNPGHTVFVHDGRSTVLFGDLVWEDGGRLTIPVWIDSYDMDELRQSVRRLAEAVTPFEVACMGHGTPLRAGGYDALRELAERVVAGEVSGILR